MAARAATGKASKSRGSYSRNCRSAKESKPNYSIYSNTTFPSWKSDCIIATIRRRACGNTRTKSRAAALIIVAPEYNNGYPGVLKNALDYLLPEYERKPIGIVTVSAGGFGGINCLAQLRLVTLGMGAFPIPESLPVSRVRDSFRDDGTPNDPAYEKRAAVFLDEVLWFAEAIADRKAKEKSSS